MGATRPVAVIQDFLGSAHIFSRTVNELLQEELRAITHDHLTFSQLKLLKLIAVTDSYNLSEFASFLGVSTAAASKAVDRLVRRGLLARATSETDRRAVRLTLTAEGQRTLDDYEVATRDVLEAVFADVASDGLERTARLLDRLSVSLLERGDKLDQACFRCGIYFREECLLRDSGMHHCYYHSVQGGSSARGQDGER